MPRVTPKPKTSPTNAKPAKKKPVKLTADQVAQRRRNIRRGINFGAAVAVMGGLLVGYTALAAHVRDEIAVADEPLNPDAVAAGVAQSRWLTIALADRPSWMTDTIAADICKPLSAKLGQKQSSRLDTSVLDEAVEILRASPWVRQVQQVRREGDTIIAACQWRQPVAIVRWGRPNDVGEYHLVADGDAEGRAGAIRLPLTYGLDEIERVISGDHSKSSALRVIDGVGTPPPQPGGSWDSDAIQAGLDMALLLYGQEAAGDVTIINVAGVANPRLKNAEVGQASPVVLQTRFKTDIYWGRPIAGSDFLVEATTDQKLENLRIARNSYVVAGYPRWIDLRFDQIVVPKN